MKTTGQRIKRLRERKGWTQLELAAALNLNNSVLSRIESGQRPVDDELLVRIADLFGTTTDYLVGRAERISESRPVYRSDRSPLFEEGFLERLHQAAFYDGERELSEEEKKIMMESLIDAAASIRRIISRTAGS